MNNETRQRFKDPHLQGIYAYAYEYEGFSAGSFREAWNHGVKCDAWKPAKGTLNSAIWRAGVVTFYEGRTV